MAYAIVVLLILIGDQAVKYWTSVRIPVNAGVRSFIPGVIDITNIHNSGAAFGILKDADARWFFIILAAAFVALVVWLLRNDVIKGSLGRWALVMVMAGGIGNCIDRIVSGYVVDMFCFSFWKSFPVFNIADIFISVCGVLFCIYLLLNKEDLSEQNPAEAVERVPRVSPRARRNEPDPMTDRVDYISQLSRPVVEGRRNIEAEKLARSIEQSEPQLGVGPGDWVVPPEPEPAPPRAKREPRSNPFEDLNAAPAGKSDESKVEWVNPFEEHAPTEEDLPQMGASPETPLETTAAEEPPVSDLFSAARPAAPEKSEGDFSVDDIIAEFKEK